MTKRLSAIVLVFALVGCSSSSKSLGRHDVKSVAAALCSLPTTAQLSGILGGPVTKRTPGKGPGSGSNGITAPLCIFISGQSRLAITMFTVSNVALIRTILDSVPHGTLGNCAKASPAPRNEILYDCTSAAAKATDLSGAPEVTARAFSGRSAVNAGWAGPRGAPLPKDSASKLSLLRSLASAAIERYGES